MLRLLRGNDGELIVRQGDPGSAFYFVASGQVRVVAGALRPSPPIERTRLLEGALFGEMALLTEQPRTASVQVVGEADLLEVSRASVAELVAAVPVLAQRLDHFARERLLKNLLASSPLFKPFDHQQQMDLIRRFEGIDVAAGTVIIRENEVGQGLFVILLGEVEVLRTDDIEGRRAGGAAASGRGVRRDGAPRRGPDHRHRSGRHADDAPVSRTRLFSTADRRAAGAAAVLRRAVAQPKLVDCQLLRPRVAAAGSAA